MVYIFKCIFLSKNVWISINISLKFVEKGQINMFTPPAMNIQGSTLRVVRLSNPT